VRRITTGHNRTIGTKPLTRSSFMKVLDTERLSLRRLSFEDATFIMRLVNEPSWLEFIGDKNVRSLEDARNFLSTGPIASYERHGFGLYAVERKADGVTMGMCGLIKRDTLPHVDLGFAFLPEYWGQGYAYEAASAVLAHGHRDFGLVRILAITSPHNESSIRVLERMGLKFERLLELTPGDPVKLFAREFVVCATSQ
jgi:RimJ/RimL family protein N-acetyltransferase